MGEGRMITAKIMEVQKENDYVTTYIMDCKLPSQPGQFITVWLPGIGERPMGIADENPLTITVAHLGEFTNAMRKLKKGDLFSFRGPFGRGFTQPKKNERVMLVGGGTGIAPLYFLAKTAKQNGAKTKIVFGARTKERLFYEARLKKVSDEVIITTEDGSKGIKGDVLTGMGKIKNIERIYTCGPEKMMLAVVKKSVENGIKCEASLERYMKCGLGVCGSCMVGEYRVCADGPVFDGEVLLKEPEFGTYRRGPSGKKISV